MCEMSQAERRLVNMMKERKEKQKGKEKKDEMCADENIYLYIDMQCVYIFMSPWKLDEK